MIEMREEKKRAGVKINEDAICRRVLGPTTKYGYIPGLGPTPRKKHLVGSLIDSEEKDYKQRYEELSTNFNDFKRKQEEKYEALMQMLQSINTQGQNPFLARNIVDSPPLTPLSTHSVSVQFMI